MAPAAPPSSEHPARLWLRTVFLPYQQRWIFDDAEVALSLKARQIGYSDATAGRAVFRGRYKKRTQVILSANENLAKEVLDKVKKHCEFLAKVGDPGALDFATANASEVRWTTGGRVLALPANPRTARSFTGDVYLDEAAYHADLEGIVDAAFPIASRGGFQVRILSTPNGAQGMFYDWCQKLIRRMAGESVPEMDGWSFHHVDLDAAISDGLVTDRKKLLALVGGDERLFAQAYNCSFLDANFQYIPTEMADRARDWAGPNPLEHLDALPKSAHPEAWIYKDLPKEISPLKPQKRYRVFAGLDIGRHNDATVLYPIYVIDGVAWCGEPTVCQATAFTKQKQTIVEARRRIGWERLFVDQTGLGAQFAEELYEMWGSEMVGVTFTKPIKEDLVTRALRWHRDNKVRYPRGLEGQRLHADVIAVRRTVTKSNNITYDSPRTSAGHGDRFWAFALALAGCGEPQSGTSENPLANWG